jgi:protein-L-isoaspartate O-methyltransferase
MRSRSWYDRARPGYPPSLVDELTWRAQLDTNSRVLEVGPGTGQLTVRPARIGCPITAVELGSTLAAVARRNLMPFPYARVEVSAFERWQLPQEPFDLVVSATAFHWIDPAVRVIKAADALKPRGMLARPGGPSRSGGRTNPPALVRLASDRAG